MERAQAHRQFQTLNQTRLQRLLDLAPSRHGLILELLPLFFHINAKSLPGFINDDIPAGIVDFRPSNELLDKAVQLDRSFRHRHRALRKYPIRGLYLLNPQGGLNYSPSARVEVWLVHNEHLNENDISALQEKISAVQQWCHLEGLELDIRLYQESSLSQDISAWQLELFYAVGLVLAGSHPYWWITTVDEDLDYTNQLSQLATGRLLGQYSFINFGPPPLCDALTRFNLLSEAIHRCYSERHQLLALLFFRTYLNADKTISLSQQAKSLIYENAHLDALELHYIMWTCLPEHAQLDQEALYGCYRESLSKTVKQPRFVWRREQAQRCIDSWQWDQRRLELLDSHYQSYSQASQYFEQVGDVISEAMRALLTFNIEHQLNQQNALSELSHMYRRFYQTGEKQIKLLPSVFKPEANTEKLYLYRFETDKRWHMSHVPLNNASQNALFTHAELIHLLAFAVGNHLLTKSNWLSINDEFQRVNTVYGVELAHQLSRSDLTLDQADFSLDHSTNSDALKQVMLFVNIEMLPDETLSQQGINLSSNLNDPLNYSSFQKCLVARIDTLFQTDSGVWHSMVYEGVDAVPALLTDIINAAPSSTFDCQVWCPTPIFGHAISERLRLLLDSLHQHHQAYPHHGRLLLNIASRGYTIEWQAQRAAFQRRALHQDIWQELSNQRDAFTPTLMDRHLDKDKLFETLLSHQQADRISAFIYSEKSTIICYLLDEYGNLVRQQFQHLTERTLLGHLKQFLGEIQRQNTIAHLQFYRLSRLEQRWLLTPLSAPTMTEGYLPIKITLSGLESAADCTVLCGQKWFEGAANDPNLFQKIRDLVLSVRKQHQHYPIYLNSLQFTSGSYYPAGLYFQQKQRLERLVNPN